MTVDVAFASMGRGEDALFDSSVHTYALSYYVCDLFGFACVGSHHISHMRASLSSRCVSMDSRKKTNVTHVQTFMTKQNGHPHFAFTAVYSTANKGKR